MTDNEPRASSPSNLIGGSWERLPGGSLQSRSPADPSLVIWDGSERDADVDRAVSAAIAAQPAWRAWDIERRAAVLLRAKEIFIRRVSAFTSLLRAEVGKPTWDARAEAALLAAKIEITLDCGPHGGRRRVTPYGFAASPTREARCDFRPHGVMAVVGPFNFPAHLPNGHIIPALLMGNAVILKPSEKAPAVGQLLAEVYDEALVGSGAPGGVLNLVQGGPAVASRLVAHDGIDGVLFTGSFAVGRRILEANLDRPGRISALEMGGSSAAIVMPDANLRQALIECVRSAFVGAGQRCTCTRRLIVHRDAAAVFIPALCNAARALVVAPPDSPRPVFMGPMISSAARRSVLEFQASARAPDGEILVPTTELDPDGKGGWYLSPGIMRVRRFVASTQPGDAGRDEEIFGPLLRVSVTETLDDALAQANATRFGLAASIFTRDETAIRRFLTEVRAGCLNVNTGTAGASSKLPFGGLGLSGNHRPAGSFSLDYCAYPVASMVERGDDAPMPEGVCLDPAWLN
ncbi:MAG: aldehyde dehydrogenase family protein [Phycisphaerae bacterium]|nr:aldehyde dehydrogenase family protein [Phycisphaerae bacterium]